MVEAEELKSQLLELKNNMNTKRTNFDLYKNHKIVITKN